MILGTPKFKTKRSFEESHALTLNSGFQHRYVSLLTLSISISSGFFLLAAFYFTKQNQNIFKDMAFEIYPTMVKHIERESDWLLILLGLTFVGTAVSTMWISRRMTSHLIDPLIKMENHMRFLIVGEWEKSGFRFSESSDFKDLAITYDYLLNTLKSTTEQELEQLMRMRLDSNDKEIFLIWTELINLKRKRLGLLPIDLNTLSNSTGTSLTTGEPPSLHRVS
jgi:hypothetical protein